MSVDQSWKSTWIWKILEEKCDHSSPVTVVLGAIMPDIQTVLISGGTSPRDFSLHDAGHAFRVTKLMRELIPEGVRQALGSNELALLLLSAYLHDIGMTPQWGKVTSHRNYLLNGETDGFRGEELEPFQVWLAVREGIPFTPPVRNLQKAEELLTYYCRSRHNDWSAEWIAEHLSGLRPQLYPEWVEDLILICRSHHEGFEFLVSPGFDPRDLGREGVVHRRYLAMVLRVADVLENDPERTPDVILRHRVITASSEPYWQKDHAMHQRIDGNRVAVSAEPPSAVLFSAIEDNVDLIERELVLCDRLQREKPLNAHPVTGEPSLAHSWVIEPYVVRKIQPPPGKYDYIPGAFRPNTRKVLELLGGQHLYEDRLAAVRELLQNAIDAVTEQMARTQLKRNRLDERYRSLLALEHGIQLELTATRKGYRLSCRDSGVGMSKSVIKDQLLVSGQPASQRVVDFQLRCRRAGLRFDRIAQFGIGVLSYFMIADHVIFRTRPSLESDLEETQGWEFETWGVGSFGELRRAADLRAGTEVYLDLRETFVQSVEKQGASSEAALFAAIAEYVRQTILWSPCAIDLNSTFENCKPVRFGPGWTCTNDAMRDEVSAWVDREVLNDGRAGDPSLSDRERENVVATIALKEAARKRVRENIRWFGPHEGELPDGMGSFRIMMPYFELPGGESAVFLFLEPTRDAGSKLLNIDNVGHGFCVKATMAWSIMGIGTVLDPAGDAAASFGEDLKSHSCRIEVSIRGTTGLALDAGRRFMRLETRAAQWIRLFIAQQVQVVHSRFLQQYRDSVFGRLSARFFRLSISGPRFWAAYDAREGEVRWRKFDFPCTVIGDSAAWDDRLGSVKNVEGRLWDWRGLSWRGHSVGVCREVRLSGGWPIRPWWRPPDHVVCGIGRPVAPVVVWAAPDTDSESYQAWGFAAFPPEWREVVGSVIKMNWWRVLLVNSGHPWSRYAGGNAMARAARVLASPYGLQDRSQIFPAADERQLLRSNPFLGFDWLMACAASFQGEKVFSALKDQDRDFIPALLRLLGLEAGSKVVLLNSENVRGFISAVEISHDEGIETKNHPLDPARSDEWRLVEVRDVEVPDEVGDTRNTPNGSGSA
jgi:hypothetical protein